MKKSLHKLSVVLLLLSLTLPIFASSTPAANDGKWYYVKSQRFGSGGPWWTFGTKVTPGALTKADNQKFTLVSIGETTNVTIKEFGGTLMATAGAFSSSGAATGWAITPNTVQSITGMAFPGEEEGLHQGNDGWNWEVRADGWYDLTDYCTFFFYEATADADLNIAIDDATIKICNAVVGTRAGQTPQAAYDNYQAAINTAKTTLGSTDAGAIQTAITNLNTATTTFNSSKNLFVQASTASSPIWYLVKNTVRGGKGATLYTNGFNAQLLCTTVANAIAADGTGTGVTAPSLKYLFRFEIQANGSYRIVNAALPSGEVLQGASGGSSSAVIKYGTATTPATTWNLNALGYNTTLSVDEIKFVSTGNGTVFHDAGHNALVSWDENSGTASAWYVEQFTGDVSPLFQNQYDALTTQYNTIADGSGNPVAPYILGTNPGQYDAVKFQAVKDAYSAMVTEKNTNGITSSNMIQKFSDLTVAISAFNTSRVAPVAYGGSINTGYLYTLKLIQPGSVNNGFYLSNPRTDAGSGTDANRPYAPFVETTDPTCAWKFVASATAGKYILVSNRKTNEYLDEEGRVRDASSYGDNSWTTKSLMQNTTTYTEGTTLLIVKIDANSNYYITGTAAGVTLGRSASNWSTFKLEQYTPTSNTDAKESNAKAFVVNGTITVTDTDNFNVYSVTGAKVQNTNLKQGVYFVKTATQTFKVFVK